MATETEELAGGGYVTRGRGARLEREIIAMEARLTERIDELERRLSYAETAPLDMVRALVASGLAFLRERADTAPAQPQRERRPA